MTRNIWLANGAFVLLLMAAMPNGANASNRFTPLVRAVERARPAVVNIHSQKTVASRNPSLSALGASPSRMSGMGTGVVIDERGYIVTNYHVIEDVSSLRISLVNGETYAAEIVARDPQTDLAVLRIHPLNPLQVMPMGVSEDLMHGETVIAIGNAFGYEHTVTQGIISELHRDVRLSDEQSYKNLIQTDASINPGNSGGPLINADGDMIGLNVAIRAGAQGISFAIPVDEVKAVVAKLLSVRSLNRVWHGLDYSAGPMNADHNQPVIVRRVDPKSPAERAGIQEGDQLLSLDGKDVRYAFDVERAFLDRRASDDAVVTFLRNGQPRQVKLLLDRAPSEDADPIEFVWRRLGARLSEVDDQDHIRQVSTQLRGGLRVIDVAESSIAARAGIRRGDILVGLHQWETLTLENVVFVLKQSSALNGSPVRFFLIRNGGLHKGWMNFTATE